MSGIQAHRQLRMIDGLDECAEFLERAAAQLAGAGTIFEHQQHARCDAFERRFERGDDRHETFAAVAFAVRTQMRVDERDRTRGGDR